MAPPRSESSSSSSTSSSSEAGPRDAAIEKGSVEAGAGLGSMGGERGLRPRSSSDAFGGGAGDEGVGEAGAGVWRMSVRRLAGLLGLLSPLSARDKREEPARDVMRYDALCEAADDRRGLSSMVLEGLREWGRAEVADYGEAAGVGAYVGWAAKCHAEWARLVGAAPMRLTPWYMAWALARALAMSPHEAAPVAGGQLRAELAELLFASAEAWARARRRGRGGGGLGEVEEAEGAGGGGAAKWQARRRAAPCSRCGLRPGGWPSGMCNRCWRGAGRAPGRVATVGWPGGRGPSAHPFAGLPLPSGGYGQGGAVFPQHSPAQPYGPAPAQPYGPAPPSHPPPTQTSAPRHGARTGGRGRGRVWSPRGAFYLPLCKTAGCEECLPWRDAGGGELAELVEVAEGMRAAGWRPHQEEEAWDRVEEGAEPAPALSQPLAGAVLRMQAMVCGHPRRPRFFSAEEGAAGGVTIGVQGPVGPAAPVTVTGARDREAVWKALVADVAAGVLERGAVVAKGRVFVGPKDRVIYDPAAVNAAIPIGARSVRYGTVSEAYAFGVGLAVKLDLKDAFKSVCVARDDRPYLGLEVDGVVLRYAALPFGLATAPKLFVGCLARTLAAVDACRLVAYMDDILVLGADEAEVVGALGRVVTALVEDGWRVSARKTYARPTAGPLFLGFRLGLGDRTIALSRLKLPGVLAKADLVARQARTWARHLQELVGFTAWAAPALRGVGFVVPALDRAWRAGVWDGEAAQSMATLMEMLQAAASPVSIDPPARQVVVVTDASDVGWAVVVVGADGAICCVERGELGADVRAWSSTAREAVAVVQAARVVLALTGLQPGGLSVHVSTDSAALAHVFGRARTRSPEVAAALRQIVEWTRQGMAITASWRRRSEGLQPLADAASAGHTWWHPGPEFRRWLQQFGADVHAGAGAREHSVAARFTSVVDDEVRAAVLDAAHAAGGVAWTGWVGAGFRLACAGLSILCHPEWGAERKALVALQAAARVVLVTRARLVDAHAFRALRGSVRIVQPPARVRWWVREERAGASTAPLDGVGEKGRGPTGRGGRAPSRPGPGPGRPRAGTGAQSPQGLRWYPDLIVVDYVPGPQADAEEQFRLALAQCLNPGPGLADLVEEARRAHGAPVATGSRLAGLVEEARLASAPGSGTAARLPGAVAEVTPRQVAGSGAALADMVAAARAAQSDGRAWCAGAAGSDGLKGAGGGGEAVGGVLRRLGISGGRRRRAGTRRKGKTGGVGGGRKGVEQGGGVAAGGDPRAEGEACPLVGDVLRAVAEGRQLVGADLGPEAERQIALVKAAVERPGASSAKRAARAAGAMLLTAQGLGAAERPASGPVLDKVALMFVHGRTTGPRSVLPVTALEDVSALAAALRAHGFPAAPLLGPATRDYLARRGAMQRRQHSNALPIPMSWLLGVEPPRGTPDHETWASRMLQAAFCLRPGIAGQVRRGNLVRWGPGWILTWIRPDKTRRRDVLAASTTPMSEWRVTATAQPQAVAAIELYWDATSDDADLVFPRATPRVVMDWLRRTWTADPSQVPRLTAHGFRLGADMELHELRVPSDYINVMGWWARKDAPGKSMRSYYNSTSLGRLMCTTSFLGRMTWAAPAAGVHVGPGLTPPRWEKEWVRFRKGLPDRPPDIRGPAVATLGSDDDE